MASSNRVAAPVFFFFTSGYEGIPKQEGWDEACHRGKRSLFEKKIKRNTMFISGRIVSP
jgi:hypothetical protein